MSKVISIVSWQAVKWVLDDAPTTDPAEAFVLVAIAEKANEVGGGEYYSSIDDLVRRTRLSKSTVLRALKRLQSARLLRTVGRSPRGSNRFEIVMTPARCHGDTAGGVMVTPDPSVPTKNHLGLRPSYGRTYQRDRTSERDRDTVESKPIGCNHQPACTDAALCTRRSIGEMKRRAGVA